MGSSTGTGNLPAIKRRPPLDRRLLRTNSGIRHTVELSVSLGALSAGGALAQAIGLGNLIAAGFTSHGRRVDAGDLWLFGIGVMVVACTTAFGAPVTERSARAAAEMLRKTSLDKVLDAPPSWDLSQQRDALTTLLSRGIDAITLYLSTYLPALVLAVIAPMVVLAWIWSSDALSGVIVTSTVVVLPIFMVLLGKEAADRMRRTWDTTSRLAGHFGDVARGMRTLRSFDRSGVQIKVLEAVSEELRATTMGTLKVALLSSFALELLASVATALVALSLGLRLLGGHVQLGVALSILIITPEVYLPLRRASARYHEATDGVGAMSALGELDGELATHSQQRSNSAGEIDSREFVGNGPLRIDFDEVQLTRLGVDLWESPLSFTIEAGSHCNLVGRSGAGKSTVIAMLLQAALPTSGQITVNGYPLERLSRSSWLPLIGWLPQHPTFPGMTLREALTMRSPDCHLDELRALCAAVGLQQLSRCDGNEFDLDATRALRGFSTGERHRLALIRTLLGAPELLVLDEPFAHLDGSSARRCATLIESRWGRTSALLASHERCELVESDSIATLQPQVLSHA